MELIKQLNEMADEAMDRETFERLVRFAVDDIARMGSVSEDEKLEVIHGMIENIAGYEEAEAAMELATRVLAEVNRQL